jgi:ubiquitin-protein ligase
MNPRLRRLQADYDLVREVFSGHPHVRVEALGSRLPPENYRVDFQLPGLYLDGEQPNYRDSHSVEIMLPREYPAEKPYCVPLTPVFHPNIRDYYCLADYWAAGQTLVDVIVKIGDMIQWRTYNPASPLDAIAAKWAVQQEPTGIFPISKIDLGVSDFQVQLRPSTPPDALAAVDGAGNLPDAVSEPADDDFVIALRR